VIAPPQQSQLQERFGPERPARRRRPGRVEQFLGGGQRVGRPLDQLGGKLLGGQQWIVGDGGDQSVAQGIGPGKHLGGHGEPLGHIHRQELAQRHRTGHIRDQAPPRLHDRQLAVRRRDPEVRGQGHLQAAAVAVAVYGRDHRNRQLAPSPAGLLEQIGLLPWELAEVAHGAQSLQLRSGEVQPGTERAPVATQNHDAHRTVASQSIGDRGERLQHRQIQAVHLVGPVERRVGDAISNFDGDPIH